MPISETGTATLGISVARALRRKTNTTSITRQIEVISVISTSWTEARMVVVRSSTMVMFMPWGSTACKKGTASEYDLLSG